MSGCFLKYVQHLDFLSRWNGALTNNNNNDGQGRAKTDKSNIITVAPKVEGQPANMGKGWPGNTRFTKIDAADTVSRFMGVDAATARKLAVPCKYLTYMYIVFNVA